MSSMEATDGASAVMKLASMVHLLEGSDSPRFTRLCRRAEALRATSHVTGSAGVLATEGSSSLATLAAAHASRSDYVEASRLQQRAIDYETNQCRRLIREFKRSTEGTDRANECSTFPEEPLLIKREDISQSLVNARLAPPHIGGQLAVLASLYATLADYQQAAKNDLECHASRRKVRTLTAAFSLQQGGTVY